MNLHVAETSPGLLLLEPTGLLLLANAGQELHEDPLPARQDGEKPRTSQRRPETRAWLAVGGGRRREARARAVCRFPRRSFSNPELSLLGFSQLHHRIPLLSTGGERAAGDSRRGDGRSGRERGASPRRLDSASEAQPGCSPRPDETSASDGGQGAALRSSPVYSGQPSEMCGCERPWASGAPRRPIPA